jgi:hypothetical protein
VAAGAHDADLLEKSEARDTDVQLAGARECDVVWLPTHGGERARWQREGVVA